MKLSLEFILETDDANKAEDFEMEMLTEAFLIADKLEIEFSIRSTENADHASE